MTRKNSVYGSIGPRRQTGQMRPIPGREADMAENNAGGFVFKLDKFQQLTRFLILGSAAGTYYVNSRALTKENADVIRACIAEDWNRTLYTIIDVSVSGRAKSNDPALFALAVMASSTIDEARLGALSELDRVARTGTHLFAFLEFVLQFRGWSRSLRNAVAGWYRRPNTAYQVVKYRQRNGWTHRDVLRLAHAKPMLHELALFHWIARGEGGENLPDVVKAHVAAMNTTYVEDWVDLIERIGLPWEALPTEALKHAEVWRAILRTGMPMTAMLRNLGRMTANGAIDNEYAKVVISAFSNEELIRAARVHPFAILVALRTYETGQGLRGKLTWKPRQDIINVLENAFYLAFDNVEPTGKRILHALDVSGSMGNEAVDNINMTAREAAAAMMLVSMKADNQRDFFAFSHELTCLQLPEDGRLTSLINQVTGLSFGLTDASLPFEYALKNQLDYDAVIVYTDSETYAGRRHVDTVLKEYAKQVGHPVKLVVVGMTSTGFTIGDPNNPDILNVSGMDANVPGLVSDFIAGRLDVDFIDQEKPIPAFDDPDVGNPDAE